MCFECVLPNFSHANYNFDDECGLGIPLFGELHANSLYWENHRD